MKTARISEMVNEMETVWVKFIVDMGYTKEQGEAFAKAYADRLAKLPVPIAKLRALEIPDNQCMTAGFEAAGIDEDEAFERFERIDFQ